MAAADPVTRSMAASIAASTRWAHEQDRTKTARAGQQGMRARLAREVDPNGTCSAAELKKRVDAALSAHMTRIALKSRATRAARAARRAAATPA